MRWIALSLWLVVFSSAGFLSGTYVRIVKGGKIINHQMPFMKPPFNGEKELTVLILGLDEKDKLNPNDPQRSDSMMLARIDLANKRVSGVSIPRDTLAEIPGAAHKDKINSAYALGGVDRSLQAVERLTGITPEYYVVSNVSGFKQLVDLIGGIDLDVEKKMDYDDNWQNLHIHLKKGFQHLDGEHAMEFVRFRHDKFGDIARMQRQQKFMKAVAERMMALSNLPKLPRVISEMKASVNTNIETDDLAYLATTLRNVSGENIRVVSLPGTPKLIHKISYLVLDDEKMHEILSQTFDLSIADDSMTVEVLNGTKTRGLATTFAKKLEDSGYKVVRVANAKSESYETSRVLCQSENKEGANRIISLLGTGDLSAETEAPDADATKSVAAKERYTVIIGEDYAQSRTR